MLSDNYYCDQNIWGTLWQYRLWSFLRKDTKLERFLVKINCSKVQIFWEAHKILRNLHQLFDWQYIGQIIGGDFAISKYMIFKMKLQNVENWSSGELQKVPIFDFQSQFSMSKFFRIFLIFFRSRIEIWEHIFCYCHFLITSIFKSLYFLKWYPIFDSLPLLQLSKFGNFIWLQLICSQKPF